MPPRRNTRPFKAPRQATEKGTTTLGVGHRKDNAEWRTRMEKTLAQMDERKQAEEKKGRVPQLKSLSEREDNEMAQTGDMTNWSSDSDGDTLPIKDTIQTKTIVDEAVIHKVVGMKIARDFGKKGVFLGEVVAVEYDSEDVDKNEDIFVVEYTDGDREDMNKEEVSYANDFYVQVSGIDDDTPEGSLHTESGEEESYRPSPPVRCFFFVCHLCLS